MEYEYLTDELETTINGLRFLNHLIQRDWNQTPLERPITQLEKLYSDLTEFNVGVQDFNDRLERVNFLCSGGKSHHPDVLSWLEENKSLYKQRKSYAKRFRETTGDCFIQYLDGISIDSYETEYQELVSQTYKIGKYLDQEASKKGSLPKSGVERADEIAFARMRKKIEETGDFR